VIATRTYASVWILASVYIIMGGIVSSFLIYKQNESFKSQTKYQRTRIAQQSELIASTRRSGLVLLMNNLLNRIDDELNDNPKRNLSDETIARIAGLSNSFKPYTYVEIDSLSDKKLSPERGQLLLALSNMNIDTGSLIKIMFQTSFSGADLRDADLSGADLRGADLRGADLQDANLKGANLKEADLRASNLWGANLREANLTRADLKRADLRWAVLNGANLRRANLNGADLSSAKLRKADLGEAIVQWANLSGVLLNEASLVGTSLGRTNLERANLSNANLSEANLRSTNLSEANLTGAELVGAFVSEENWLILLNELFVTGAKEIHEKYKIVDDVYDGISHYQVENIKG
jgi:uncharacterized protein YjbI with pentapeptide repeats